MIDLAVTVKYDKSCKISEVKNDLDCLGFVTKVERFIWSPCQIDDIVVKLWCFCTVTEERLICLNNDDQRLLSLKLNNFFIIFIKHVLFLIYNDIHEYMKKQNKNELYIVWNKGVVFQKREG